MKKSLSRIWIKNIVALLGLAIFFVLTSCEEDLTETNKNANKNFPSRIISVSYTHLDVYKRQSKISFHSLIEA